MGAGTGRIARACLRALLVAVMALAWAPVSATAWSNGPDGGNGFGTHDWVLYQANKMAAAQGYGWLDYSVAQPLTDDPDTAIHDTVHHVYHVGGNHYGSSPSRVQELFDQAVLELKSGDREGASRTFGLLSHYYSDTCMPLHTAQTPAEEPVHEPLEDAQDRVLEAPGDLAGIVSAYELKPTTDPKRQTIEAATVANHDYTALVGEFAAFGYDGRVRQICDRALNNSVDGVADLQAGVGQAAGVPRWARNPDAPRWGVLGVASPRLVWIGGGAGLVVVLLAVLLLATRRIRHR